jgi:hypothetical protein
MLEGVTGIIDMAINTKDTFHPAYHSALVRNALESLKQKIKSLKGKEEL